MSICTEIETDLSAAPERWRRVADELAGHVDPECVRRRTLARNLAALAECRPAIYRQVIEALRSTPPLPEPTKQDARYVMTQVREKLASGAVLSLAGVGDGSVLRALALHEPTLLHGRRPAVYVFEPDLLALAGLLGRVDLSAPGGPIASSRFRWHVGPSHLESFEEELRTEKFAPIVSELIHTGSDTHQLAAELRAITDRVIEADAMRLIQNAAYYNGRDGVDAIAGRLDRKPRVMLITSRFTSVQIHATRDLADAFESLGWDAFVLCESEVWHTYSRSTLVRAIHEFRPDLVVQINHLRAEHGEAVPAGLPFVTWIQDHFDNLTSATAGRSVGPLDFVLTASTSVYRDRYGYPASQLVPIHKLTRVPYRPANWANDGEDLAFVTNASADPAWLAERDAAAFDGTAAHRDLLRKMQRRILETYEIGGSLQTAADVIRVITDVAGESLDEAVRQQFVRLIVHPFNDALYRQQGLLWAADIAERNGLTLGVYGNGWEKHARLAKHARGPIAYGRPLEELTRRTRINLQIMPNCCLHQRLLDGLVAGGFYLIRRNTADTLLTHWANFITHKLPAGVTDSESARRLVPPTFKDELESLLGRADELSVIGEKCDPVSETISIMQTGHFDANCQLLPRLDEVMFDTPAEFESLVTKFLANESLRREIAAEQRESVEARKSYTAGVRKVIDFIRTSLESAR